MRVALDSHSLFVYTVSNKERTHEMPIDNCTDCGVFIGEDYLVNGICTLCFLDSIDDDAVWESDDYHDYVEEYA